MRDRLPGGRPPIVRRTGAALAALAALAAAVTVVALPGTAGAAVSTGACTVA